MSRTRAEVIAAVYDAWAAGVGDIVPDPAYSQNSPSQYAEGIVALSAPVADQDEFVRLVAEALAEEFGE